MANFTALKTAINNAIKTNGNEEITGAILQAILDAMVETLGDSAITDLENAITTEVTNRENAVGDVAADLAAEALARANKDNQLDNRINQEEYNRQNADAALSQTMSQGFQTLGSQMTALNAAISALNAAYQNGYLYGGIATPSSSPSNNKCFYIALQGGTYTNFGGVGVVEGINIIKNDSGWKVEHIYDQTTLLNEFYLLRQQVIRALASYEPIVVYGDVTNVPDEEDLTSNAQHLLKFKDRDYSPLNFSGLGMKILRKNILPLNDSVAFNGFLEGVTAEETLAGSPELIFWDRMNTRFVGIKDGIYYAAWTDDDNYVPASTSLVYMYDGTPYQWTGSDFIVDETEVPNLVNCLTQDMINEANTIYIIRYDYTLEEDIIIPANCVLQFDGGSISNANGNSYSLTCDNTEIKAGQSKIFGNVTINGSVKNYKIYLGWWHEGVTNEDCTFGITNMCAICQPSWEIMHEMVLINNSIKVDPDVFIVNGVSIEGNNCILRSTKDDFSGIGLKYLYGNGFSTNMVQEVKNFRIMDFNIGLWAYDQIRATNLTCQNNNIGCRIGTGGAYISDFEKCVFFRNRQYGVVTEKDGGGIADTKFVRCWLSGNAYANALHKGDTFVRYIECNIEGCGRGRNIGYGIICNGYPTGLYIRDCYFERGSNGVDGKYKDISVLVFGKLSEIDDDDVRADLENIGVGLTFAVGDSRCKVEISGTAFININGLYFSCVQAVQLNLENLYFGIPQDAEHCYGVRLNYVSGPYWKGYFSNIQFYNYTKGIAKTAFSFSTNTSEAYAAAIAKQLRLDGVRLGYYTIPYHIFYTFNNNEHLLDCAAGTNKVPLYEVGYKLRNATDFVRKTIYRENNAGTTVAFYFIKSGANLAGKYVIIFGRVGTSFVYTDTNNQVTRVYITECVQIIKLPSNLAETKGLAFQYTPYYIIALTEEEFKNNFDCIGFDVIESVQINTGYINIWPEIYVTRENANAAPLQYCNGDGVKYYLDGFKALGKKGSTRPTLTNTAADIGYQFFDEHLTPPRPIWWIGTGWVDATGATV